LRLLIFSATASNGYRHACIPAAAVALTALAGRLPSLHATAEATEDPAIFTPESLAQFGVIVLLQTAGDFLSPGQLDALKGFVLGGGGVVAIHGASTGMPGDVSGWYARLIGAAFQDHPQPQNGLLRISNPTHPILAGSMGKEGGVGATDEGAWEWRWFDEWYNFKSQPSSNVQVLMVVDEGSYTGGIHGEEHPIAWCQEFEGGRSFYTALGHFEEAYRDATFLEQLQNAILWAA
ncbi:class I glutamine amidotransferase-like protein, partial [Thozetella sp. PMI_491]